MPLAGSRRADAPGGAPQKGTGALNRPRVDAGAVRWLDTANLRPPRNLSWVGSFRGLLRVLTTGP